MGQPLRILFAGGGTGGHLFPGLAVADELLDRANASIGFCGVDKSFERDHVTQAGYDYFAVDAAPLRTAPMGLLRALYNNGRGYREAFRIITHERPDMVVGLGGYSSVPLGLAAARHGVPLVLLEQNAVPGRANRLLSRAASAIAVTFEASAQHFAKSARVVCTGNPLRRAIATMAFKQGGASGEPHPPALLVLGGSQGAHSLNRAVCEALPRLAPLLGTWHVIHQTGPRDAPWVAESYRAAGVRAEVQAFIGDMAAAYARTTLAISRAGATTLTELAALAIPAVLVPYPHAAADHQRLNAEVFQKAGAVEIVHERDRVWGEQLVSVVEALMTDTGRRAVMRRAMLGQARPDAAAQVAREIINLLGRPDQFRQPA